MADKKNPQTKTADDEQMERHEPPRTDRPITAPKFGSAGSGGAELERGPERHQSEEEQKGERDKEKTNRS